MAPFVAMLVGSVVRTVLAAASGVGAGTSMTVEQGVPSVQAGDEFQAFLSALGIVVTFLWSAWQKRKVSAA